MNKGIGRLLMLKLEKWIKNKKKSEIFLNSSPFALRFYKKLGYKRLGKKRLYHGLQLYPMIKET